MRLGASTITPVLATPEDDALVGVPAQPQPPARLASNAGLLEKTAATGVSYFDATLNNTGTLLVTSGDLDLQAGGTLVAALGGRR